MLIVTRKTRRRYGQAGPTRTRLFVSDEAEQQPHLSFWKVEETANLCPQLWQATSKLKGLPLRLKLSPFMREWLKNSYFLKPSGFFKKAQT
jgi:hypothetical protein